MHKARVQVLETRVSFNERGKPVIGDPIELLSFTVQSETIDGLRSKARAGAVKQVPNRRISLNFGPKTGETHTIFAVVRPVAERS